MKKINILIALFTIAIVAVSCETYDDYQEDRKSIVGFSDPTANINNVPTGSFKDVDVEVFASDISNVDRIFNVVSVPAILDLSTIPPQVEADPENYTFDSTVTIPANSREGVIKVYGTNVSIGDTDEYFTIAIEGTANVVSGGSSTIRLRK